MDKLELEKRIAAYELTANNLEVISRQTDKQYAKEALEFAIDKLKSKAEYFKSKRLS